MKNKTLLQIAKETRILRVRHKLIDAQVIDLSLAWMKGEVSWTQAKNALYPDRKNAGSDVYGQFAGGLRRAYQLGRIKIK